MKSYGKDEERRTQIEKEKKKEKRVSRSKSSTETNREHKKYTKDVKKIE